MRPEALLVHAWKIVDHVLATDAAMTEADANALHGRTVEVRAAGYTSPWHGTCDDAGRQRRKRVLADVTLESDVTTEGRQRIARFGFDTDLFEFKLSCNDPGRRAPTITIYVANERAMTCFAGVCYLLAR